MSEHLTDAELGRILALANTELRSRKPLSLAVVALLNTEVPRLVTEFRAIRQQLLERSAEVRARDAQLARYRQIVEGAEVGT